MKLIMENWKRFLKESDEDDWSLEAQRARARSKGFSHSSTFMGPETVAEEIRILTAMGRSPEDIQNALLDQGAELEDIMAGLEQAFQGAVPDEEVEVDLNEGVGLDSAEYLLGQMSVEARADILRTVEEAILGHAPANEEGLAYVADRLGRDGDAELEENEEELLPMILALLGNPKAVAKLKRKLDLGEVDPDAYAL
jgi:hypothetical protein